MVIQQVIYNVGLFFVMMVPGLLLKKCGLATENLGKGLSNLVLYIAQPALVFLAYLVPFDTNILINSVYVLAFSVLAHVLFAAAALLSFKRAPDNMRRMLRFATVFSNAAFLGIPLISAVLEPLYPGATLYASIYNITFNLFLWSLGVYICTEDRDEDGDGVTDGDIATDYHEVKKKASASLLRAVTHPVTIAALLGLVFFILPIHTYVPALAVDALTMLKNMVAPVSMAVIGLRLADMDFHGILKDKYMYGCLLLRHVILPVALLLILKLIALIIPIDECVIMVVMILAAAPSASSATMFAEKYDCDAAYVSRLVTVSTLLCIVTIPLILLLV